MSYRDERVPEDTAINLNIPTENIEVSKTGRFYPDEFSGQIQANYQQQERLAEIPKSLTNIVESFDDYRISLWSDEEHAQMNNQHLLNRVDNEVREQALKLDVSNSTYDLSRRMDSDMQLAIAKADQENTSKEVALQEVFEGYQNPEEFQGNPAYEQAWAPIFHQTALSSLEKAQQEDLAKNRWTAQANVEIIFSDEFAFVRNGSKTSNQAMKDMMPKLMTFAKQLPSDKAQDLLNGYWNQLVLGEALQVADKHKLGEYSDQEAMDALKEIASSCKKVQFLCQDAEGNYIKEKDGSNVQMSFVLTPETQNELAKVFTSSSNSGGGADEILKNQEKDYKQRIGWDELEKTGFSDKMFTFNNLSEFDAWQASQLMQVQQGKAGNSAKIGMLREMTKCGATARASMVLSNIAKGAKQDLGTLLTGLVTDLEADLKSGKVKEGYSLSKTIDGKEYVLAGPGAYELAPALGNMDDATFLYWDTVLPIFKKAATAVANGESASLLYKIDKDYKNASNALSAAVSSSNLLTKQGDQTIVNPKAVTDGVAALENMNSIAGNYGVSSDNISDETINTMMTSVDDPQQGFDTEDKKLLGSMAIAGMFMNSGKAGSLYKYNARNKGSAAANRLNLATTMLALKQSPDGEANSLYSELYELHTRDLTDPNRAEKLKGAVNEIGISKKVTYEFQEKLLKKYNIPQSHLEGGMLSGVMHDLELIAAKKGQRDTSNYEKNFKSVVNSLYLPKPKGTKYQNALYLYSPQMAQYDTAEKRDRFVQLAQVENRKMKEAMVRAGLTGTYQNMYVKTDDATGLNRWAYKDKQGNSLDIDVLSKGKSIPIQATYDDLTIESPNYEIMGGLNAVGTVSALLATNKEAADKFYKATLPVALNSGDNHTWGNVIDKSGLKMSFELNNIAKTINDPVKYKALVEQGTKQRSAGKVQNYAPTNPILRALTTQIFTPNEADFGATPTRDDLFMSDESKRIMKQINGNISYINKINQDNVSTPICHAAIGNEGYIDALNACEAAGFQIASAEVPGVTMGTPTGFAVNITAGMTRDRVPEVRKGEYSAAEIADLVEEAADTWGVPLNVARAMVAQESGGQPHVRSHAGAVGVMQLMPATAKSLGVTNSDDAAQNIWGGMKYMSQMLKQFGGSVPLALAAYNAGPGAVGKARGIPNNSETKNYVRNICAKAGVNIKGQGYPITMSINDQKMKFIDPDTNMLSPRGMNDFQYLIENSPSFKGKVINIATNRPELLSNKPEYADFARYRNLKNKDGKPLFVKGEYEGFKINMEGNIGSTLNEASIPALAEDAAKTQTDVVNQIDTDKLEALIKTFASRYDRSDKNVSSTFGLAGLSGDDYESYGIPAGALQNPVLQARVLAQEFQRAQTVLGSERKAIFALSGGDLVDNNGIIKSWAEVKKDKENFTKSWFIKPSSDSGIRNEINSLVAMYQAECQKLRGI